MITGQCSGGNCESGFVGRFCEASKCNTPYTEEEEEEFILENQAQTFTVMAVDITSIEINKYNIQHNLCSYWLSRGDPEGKKILLSGPPLNT